MMERISRRLVGIGASLAMTRPSEFTIYDLRFTIDDPAIQL